MNEFDQYVKHVLKERHYIRYADDFVFLSADKNKLLALLPRVNAFLRLRLNLKLHPDKVSIQTFVSGVNFLGWAHFRGHRVLRTATKRRMLKRLTADSSDWQWESYRGLMSHGNTTKLLRLLENKVGRAL